MSDASPYDGAAVHRVRTVYATWRSQPSWIHRAVGFAFFLILLGIAAFLLVWGLIVAAVIIAVTAVIVGVRSLYRTFTGDNAMRRNVRIVRRP
ncbi:MAG: hypothetical protein JNK58_06525 [Phycisphaerae bacterium]|nr:hypothetical protein [Phycisphaerae bacterium]